MKIAEKFVDGDGSTFHVKETFDPTPALASVAALRSAGATHMGESRLVGEVPGWLVDHWRKEAGISHNDNAATAEMLKKKMLDGDFSKFRVWEGTY